MPLTYVLRFGALITLLLLSSGPAHAEWEVVTGNDEAGLTAYVDQDTIRRKGDRVKMWHLLDFNTAQTERVLSFLSAKVQTEWDCAEVRHRILAFLKYSGNMGTGTVVNTNSIADIWEPVAPDTLGQNMWKAACSKQ